MNNGNFPACMISLPYKMKVANIESSLKVQGIMSLTLQILDINIILKMKLKIENIV